MCVLFGLYYWIVFIAFEYVFIVVLGAKKEAMSKNTHSLFDVMKLKLF